jgi:hypothetical protein
MNNVLRVKCKTPDCPEWLEVADGGLRRVGGSYSFPVLIASWERKYGCPVCGREHLYSHRDVRDAHGSPV